MTSFPNNPPPLPPPPIQTVNKPCIIARKAKFRVSSDGFHLPPGVEEVRDACKHSGIIISVSEQEHKDMSRYHVLVHYNQVKPLIQDGPKCGLVALCMASQLVSKTPLNVDDVFSLCKEKGYTQHGEMFSAAAMYETAKVMCSCDVTLIQDVSNNQETIIKHLMRGLPVIFPYDADRNHGPGTRQGHAAHWAVFTGVVIQTSLSTEEIEKFYEKDVVENCVYHIKNMDSVPALSDLNQQAVYVCCRQGKSNYMRLWKLSDMITSSCQMTEVSQEVLNELKNTVLPDNFISLQNDLSNQAVCLG